MKKIYYYLKNDILCPKDAKFDGFQIFKESLKLNSIERNELSFYLFHYPMNNKEQEYIMINYIEDVVDKIYYQLK